MTASTTSLNVTNLQVITVSAGEYILTGLDGALEGTNTVTLANATTQFDTVRFTVARASTNSVNISTIGVILGTNDFAVARAMATNDWVTIQARDNDLTNN